MPALPTSTATNLAHLLEASAAAYGTRTAIVVAGESLTYAELDGQANQVANLLAARGVRPGDRVALSCPTIPSFTVVYFAILKAGAVVVPLNILLTPREIAYHLDDSDAEMLVAFEGTSELPIGANARAAFDAAPKCKHLLLIEPDPGNATATTIREADGATTPTHSSTFAPVPRGTDDVAVMFYTSGTTGRPKGAELRHRNIIDNVMLGRELFRSDADDPDTYLCLLPLFHAFGQVVIQNGALAFGGTLVMLPRFEPNAALDLMTEHRVTFFGGVPTMYWGMLAALDDSVDVERIAAHLRVAVSGGAALPGEIHKQFRERFGVTILEGYGMSETSPVIAFSVFGEEPHVGSIGKPIPGVQMKLINDDWSDVEPEPTAIGEIAIKGHNVMKGYYNRPEATTEAIRDGWFRSGDLGKKDENGFYYIVDRSKDMIIRGGYNVYPREIEEIFMTHPAVSLVAVIGIPNDQHGEEVKAVVVKNPGHDDVSEADLVAWGKDQFAAYKYPRLVQFLDQLPMTSTGKILKRELN
ncbi:MULTISPECIES: long-chain-fatty-acid--CoA ligase [Nocardiaceae]|uniref:long-chain-fatty-acid--CoA ligase n=1 Tax=Nocardiaceae TaxID=85025 RepID=UPI00070CEB2C|nr:MULTISPECIES: long-chain fatty acid--CoA ligase [Rhodococcus]KQU36864.1 long-chain fatty acid--CoA ligase [Rhodococcus sp. Leaf233]MDJ0409368.1 long-chain fatty acid--CoA ligase [Rhodococcus fascians]MDP9638334.1 long-chain acyl-CoA synthetase [Rhodococcus cercidiphylli]MDQ0280230.1 long-chain acyl-CoA synthetase [Rhodococcus fascians]